MKQVCLGDICTFEYGKALPAKLRKNGTVPVYGSNGLVGYHDSSLTNGPTIVVGRKGSIGKINFSKIPAWPIDTTYFVNLKKEIVDLDWLCYVLPNLGLENLNKSSAVPGLNRKDAYRKNIMLPPLKDQKRIVKILDQADALRQKRKQAIELLDEYVKSVFLEMFGDPVTNPKGWPRKKMKDINTKITDGTHHSPPLVDIGIPYITAKHIKENDVIFFDKPTFISEKNHKMIHARCAPAHGDVLYIKDGATTGIATVNEFDFEFSLLSSVALLKPNKQEINPYYLCYWLNNKQVKEILLTGMSGVAIKRFTLSKINEFVVNLPPLDLQKIFFEILSKQRLVRKKMLKQSQELDNQFQALMQKAFKGEL